MFNHTVFMIIAAASLATIAFMLLCYFLGYVTEIWEVLILMALCVVLVVAARFLKYTIRVEDGKFSIKYIRKYEFPLDHVLDLKRGDIDILRNYSGWGLKKVKFKTYACPGIEDAISLKLAGRTVLTFTTVNVDEVYDILYKNRRQD